MTIAHTHAPSTDTVATPAPASERIRVLRPVVIGFIVLTHVPFALYRPDVHDVALGWGTFLSAWISGVVALAALPTLSVIAGWLAVTSMRRHGYARFAGNKFRRLVIPMLLWNGLVAAWIFYQQSRGLAYYPQYGLHPFDLENWVRALTAIGRIPANPPLYFLRELFLAALLLPAWRLLARSNWSIAAVTAAILYCAIAGEDFGFFLRIDIYLYVFFGVVLATRPDLAALGDRLQRLAPAVVGLLLAYTLGLALYSFTDAPALFPALTQVVRLAGPLAFWLVADALLRSPGRALLMAISPACYTVFLGHVPVLRIIWDGWQRLFGLHPYEPAYALFTASSLVLTFALLTGLWWSYRLLRNGITNR